MWIINVVLLIIGTVAAVMGISFYRHNKEATGRIQVYIISYGICSAVWCFSFGMIGFVENFIMCEWLRKLGILAVDAFLVTEACLGAEMFGAGPRIRKRIKIFAFVISFFDFIVFAGSNVDIFARKNGWTTWEADPQYAMNRYAHGIYVTGMTFLLFGLAVIWARKNKVKRLNSFFVMVFVSNFIMLFFSIPDTLLPALGYSAVSTSGIGAASCAIVMWYGATRLSSFDIRMGNIKDKLFDFMEAGVLVFDMNQEIALANRYAGQLEGNSEPARHIGDLFDIDEAEAQEIFRKATDSIYSVRLWDRAKKRAYSVRLSAVKDNYDEPFCYMCVLVDVTEEVEAVARYEVASRAKSRFLARMSHEIRTPINAVLGMNEMILRESREPEILEYAENIHSAGNTLLSLINSILDFSKIEDGKMEIVPVRYDTASLINDLVNSIAQRAEAKELEFRTEVDDTLPCAMIGDNVRMAQVIMNLLTNAVKYTEKGSVTLTVKVSEKDGEQVKLFVSVKDTGIGIRQEDLPRLFESFERLDEVRNHGIEGTGLGISIVTNLLNLMGSELQVKSVYGEGTEFCFTLNQLIADGAPMGDYEKRLKESVIHKEKEDVIYAPGAEVLVVDDNDMNLKVAANLLKLCGIKAKTISSGEETIMHMKKEHYDIVFLDHMMPQMDGIETLYKLRREGLIPEDTAMIALTANAVVGAKETYLEAGFDDYLSKPIELKELVKKLKRYLPEKSYGNGAAEKCKKEREPEAFKETEEVLEFAPEEDQLDELREGRENMILRLNAFGINADEGLRYCAGDRAFYRETLEDYVSSGLQKLTKLEKLKQNRNWVEYRILVHAMKSNAKMIGASSLADLAAGLEEAASKGQEEKIENQHGKFVEMTKSISERIRQVL